MGFRHIADLAAAQRPRIAPVHCGAGSDGGTNVGVASLAAPNAASSRVERSSVVARPAISFHSVPRDRALADQAGRDTGSNDTLDDPAEHVALAEPVMTDTREYRVIRNPVLN